MLEEVGILAGQIQRIELNELPVSRSERGEKAKAQQIFAAKGRQMDPEGD
jgi:hypothetical protein